MNHEIIAEHHDEIGLIVLYLKEGLLCDIEIDSKKHPYHYEHYITATITKIDKNLQLSILTNDNGDEFVLRNTSYNTGTQLNGQIKKLAPNKLPEIKVVPDLKPNKDAIERLQERTNAQKITLENNIIEHYDLWGQLEQLKEITIQTNGGRISIETTNALTAIDIDQSSASSTLNTNIKMAKLIARQIILRKLSGIIMIDFIRMENKKQRADIEAKLQSALKNYYMNSHFHGFTASGLYELTIERRALPIKEFL